MKINSAIYPVLLAGLMLPIMLCCKKEAIKTAPTVTVATVTIITATTATSGGEITSDGGASVTSRGVCWSASQNPTTADSKTSNATGTGSFTSSLTGLTPGATYYLKAYATNSIGTAYSSQTSLTTLALAPVLTTTAVSAITSTTATSGGNITNDGGSAVTARGVCWGTATNPTISGSKTSDATGSGSFTSAITGLTPGVTYYIRAYATNSIGTAYGNEITAATTAVLPVLTTTAISALTSTTATSGGNITSDGGSAVTARGVCWGTTTNPTISGSKTSDATGSGSFTSAITGLTPGVTYYIRAYATNSIGTAYGNEVTTTTTAALPTITTTALSAITSTTATSGGNITADGGAAVTVRGVCWGTTTNPTTAGSKTSDATGSGSFTSNITGLTPGATYYIRAYATNSIGTAYGNEITAATTAVLPVLTTTAISALTSTTATSGGNITSDGGAPVTARGVCWSTSANPTIALSTKTTDGTATGAFISSINGLTTGTAYYVRAYVTNSIGTAYGSEISFTTTSIPTLTTSATTSMTVTTATSGGNITSDGGSAVTAHGVCWSTSANPTIALSTKTTDGTGTGSFTSSLTGLAANTTYYLRAYATNSEGTNYGAELRFKTYTSTVTDIDGNVYYTVSIGTQEWMAQNLKTTKYRNGVSIANVLTSSAWAHSAGTGAYCYYQSDAANGTKYGALYNWYAVGDSRNLAPTGWHVPTDDEWTTLQNYLTANGYNYDGTTTGNKYAKSLCATTDWWLDLSTGAVGNDLTKNNSSGFTALPSGFCDYTAYFNNFGASSWWWSSTEYYNIECSSLYYCVARCRHIDWSFNNVFRDNDVSKLWGLSVRCVKD